MNVRFLVKLMCMTGMVILISACSIFGGDSSKKKEDAKKDQSKSNAQSTTGKGSIIDQELKKQYQIYNEILQYKIEQDQKLIKQSEERYKKLKAESEKPSDSKSGGDTSKKDSGGKTSEESGGSKDGSSDSSKNSDDSGDQSK
ncbi:hypothetical protein HQN89_00680 [Paenibacillus frigoriresistens]|uniref:hypothetical protein n=1 Tax=Paenibacillus alginolyticus TaxID=59839 RepID=UPI0015659ACC|nr:hypothetical protein [Paenibacillus frigoriresistens]NRF89551.1 hypothetical protein [Paenibacillus frigoriresistens]